MKQVGVVRKTLRWRSEQQPADRTAHFLSSPSSAFLPEGFPELTYTLPLYPKFPHAIHTLINLEAVDLKDVIKI